MLSNEENNNTRGVLSPNAYYREVHPEYFSDTIVRYEVPLTAELFDQQMALLSTKKMQSAFENFVVAIAKRLITPNVKPQTGPDGGGDGKVDAETYEVSDDLSDKWISTEETASGKEYWAFAISCKKKWKEKVASDVENLVGTNRGYTKALFFTNQYVKSSTRAETEETLSTKYGIRVEIYDGNWLSHSVFHNGCLQVALDTLAFSDEYKRKTVTVGPNDRVREERLSEIENSILRHIEGLDTEYIDELFDTCLLSRALERPKTEIEGRFQRAIRECEHHGSKQQMYNIVYEHAWTSYFWFEDFDTTYKNYLTLKSFLEEHCNVARVEKFTNILSNLVNSARAGFINKELAVPEMAYVEELEEKLRTNPDRKSSALYLGIYILEQRIIEHMINGEMIDDDLRDIRSLLIESASHLEISIEAHYKVIKMLSPVIKDNEQFENLIDDIAEIIASRRSKAEAARVRLARAEDHIEGKRWSSAVKQLGFCVYAFEQESCMTELIRSSGYIGIALNHLGLLYSAESFLVKSASLLVQDFFHSGKVQHLLVTVLHELCFIEVKLGRLVMYLNWYELLSVISQNSQYYEEEPFQQNCHLEDAAWACRLAVSNLKDVSIAKLPDVLERAGMYCSSEYLKYALGYSDEVDEKSLPTIRYIYESAKLREQPVFEQFYDKLNISTLGKAYAKTTVHNFTITVTYENDPQTQRVAEIFLASVESFMATFEQWEVIAVDNLIQINIVKSEGNSDIIYIGDHNEYELRLNREDFDDKVFWECLVKFFATLLCQNAVTPESLETMIETKQHGENLMDRVSVLQHTVIALNNLLGQSYKYRLEDWMRDSDKVYTSKRIEASFEEKIYVNRQQSTLTSYKVNSNMSLWNDAGWSGCAFVHDGFFQRTIIFGLAFKNVDRGKAIVAEWESDFKVKIYIIKGIDADHPTWYRVCIAPVIPSDIQVADRYFATMCRKHTMTPFTNDNLNRFEALYRRFGGCWLMAFHINEDNTIDMPFSFEGAFKFTDVEFREAYQISNTDYARMALEPDDNPLIPESSKDNAPVLEVMKEMENIIQNR